MSEPVFSSAVEAKRVPHWACADRILLGLDKLPFHTTINFLTHLLLGRHVQSSVSSRSMYELSAKL